MADVLNMLSHWQQRDPDAIALDDMRCRVSYAELAERVAQSADELRASGCRCIALLADNGIDWIIADLAALAAGISLVPLPPFFSKLQFQHLLATAPIDGLLVESGLIAKSLANTSTDSGIRIGQLQLFRRPAGTTVSRGLDAAAKITFTSGSTATPKGVCLSAVTINGVARRLADALGDVAVGRHLCVMPLATLLENIAGVYVPLMLGATVFAPRLATVGLNGSSRLDVPSLRAAIDTTRAESIILLPQILRDLVRFSMTENWRPTRLRFVAVGGARVAAEDLKEAQSSGIPAYQGYGLSECGSVVAINRPGADRRGSVGRPLSDLDVRIAEDGEIFVRGSAMSGYLNDTAGASDEIATGDLGYFDADGFLYVSGRKKNMFITSFGRNVSPEWPEAELLHQSEIAQALVCGEGSPVNTAVIVPSCHGWNRSALERAVKRANENLPDYASIGEIVVASEPFTAANGMLTATGKLQREAIIRRYLETPGAERQALPTNETRGTQHVIF